MTDLANFDQREFIERACTCIKQKIKESNSDGAVLGLSGGIDSAVVACLAVRALGSDKVIAYRFPSATTPDEDLFDSRYLKDELDIRSPYISIDEIHKKILDLCKNSDDDMTEANEKTASANLKPRIRMSLLYYFAAKHNYLVLGTGNRTELEIGYFTKHGDGGCDLLPIGDLFKQDVKKVAVTLGVPESIINKAPTAGLLPDQTDEEDLKISYPLLDRILYLYLDGKNSTHDIADILEIPPGEVERVIKMVNRAKHKTTPIPIVSKNKTEKT